MLHPLSTMVDIDVALVRRAEVGGITAIVPGDTHNCGVVVYITNTQGLQWTPHHLGNTYRGTRNPFSA